MCRLFRQSRRKPDGTGLSFFSPDGRPVLDKEPFSALAGPAFARPGAGRALHHVSNELRLHVQHLADHPSVVVASEPLAECFEWRLPEPGELVHVEPDLTVDSTVAVSDPPAQTLRLDHPTGQERSQE